MKYNIEGTTLYNDIKPYYSRMKDNVINLLKNNIDLTIEGVEADSFIPLFITGLNHALEKEVPYFQIPLSFIYDDKEYVVFNIRTLVIGDKINKGYSYDLVMDTVHIMNMVKRHKLLSYKVDIALMFSKWVSGVLTTSFTLNFRDSALLDAYMFFYYMRIMGEVNLKKLITLTKHKFRYNHFTDFDKMLDKLNMEDDMFTLIARADILSLKQLTTQALTIILSKSIIHQHKLEYVKLCSYHVPSFLALINQTASNTMYKKTMLFTIIKNTKEITHVNKILKEINR